jgi:hypothetical protein
MPVIDERARHELFVAVEDTLGRDHADTLMSLLPPVGWADVATKHDLHELETRLGYRFESVEQRFVSMDQRFEAIDQRFEAIDQRFEAIDQRFKAMDQRFDFVDQRFKAMDQRFDTLENQVRTVHLTLTTQTRMIAVTIISCMVGMAAVCVGALAFLA